MPTHPTIVDVAAEAGVSYAMASRVINGDPHVGLRTCRSYLKTLLVRSFVFVTIDHRAGDSLIARRCSSVENKDGQGDCGAPAALLRAMPHPAARARALRRVLRAPDADLDPAPGED